MGFFPHEGLCGSFFYTRDNPTKIDIPLPYDCTPPYMDGGLPAKFVALFPNFCTSMC
jgi:hypothetical protein